MLNNLSLLENSVSPLQSLYCTFRRLEIIKGYFWLTWLIRLMLRNFWLAAVGAVALLISYSLKFIQPFKYSGFYLGYWASKFAIVRVISFWPCKLLIWIQKITFKYIVSYINGTDFTKEFVGCMFIFLFIFFFVFANLKFDGSIFCYIGKNAAQYPVPRNSCASYVDVTNYLTIIRIQLNRTEVHEILQPKRTLLSRDL